MAVESEKVEPLNIILWLWRDPKCRTKYTPAHVNKCMRMIERNLTIPHRFICFTDQFNGSFDRDIELHPLWSDHHLLKTPLERWRREFPQCYVRLRAFSRETEIMEILGPRYVSIDLDCIVLGNLDALFSRKEEFLIYRPPMDSANRDNPYNASMWIINAGCRPKVWEDFKGLESLQQMPSDLRYHMTDQGWMLYKLGSGEKGWTMEDGVYMWSWLTHKAIQPPDNCKIIFFNGKMKPWDIKALGDFYG